MSIIYKAIEKIEYSGYERGKKTLDSGYIRKTPFLRIFFSSRVTLLALLFLFLSFFAVWFFSKLVSQKIAHRQNVSKKDTRSHIAIHPVPAGQNHPETLTSMGMFSNEKAEQRSKQGAPDSETGNNVKISESSDLGIAEVSTGSYRRTSKDDPSGYDAQFIPQKKNTKTYDYTGQRKKSRTQERVFGKESEIGFREKSDPIQVNSKGVGKIIAKQNRESDIVAELYRTIKGKNKPESERLFSLLSEIKGEDHPFVLNMRAYSLILDGNYETAMRFIEKILKIRPDDLDAMINKSVILLRSGKEEDARAYLLKLKHIYPENESIHLLFVRSSMGER